MSLPREHNRGKNILCVVKNEHEFAYTKKGVNMSVAIITTISPGVNSSNLLDFLHIHKMLSI